MVERRSDPPEPPIMGQLAEYHQLCHSKPFIVGADECGYGSWAGPLVVCAVAIPHNWRGPQGLNDSKKVRANKREDLFEWMKSRVPYAIAMAQSDEIDRQGVTLSLRRCYQEAVNSVLAKFPESLVVIDGEVRIPGIEHLHFPKADGIVPAVMAASIIGKVLHDRYMWQMAEKHPGYNWHKNMGYGTKDHREAIAKLGTTPLHRITYIKTEKLRTVEEMRAADDVGMSMD
jgi:ribonuclease HII